MSESDPYATRKKNATVEGRIGNRNEIDVGGDQRATNLQRAEGEARPSGSKTAGDNMASEEAGENQEDTS